jgi:NTP pyrophosphatase (non-canonical NTP hydrolase)
MDLAQLVAELARGVGSEFPAPLPEMVLREYVHLVEEADELIEAMSASSLANIRDELADVEMTAALIAHYLAIDLTGARTAAFASFTPTYPNIYGAVAKLAGPVRRYLGIARRVGGLEPVVVGLGTVMLTVSQLATNHGINLDVAIEEKSAVVLTRGWRESHLVAPAPVPVPDRLRGTPAVDVKS